MNRRNLICALLGLPAALPLASEELPKIPLSAADAVADGLSRFLNKAELATFRDLAQAIVPAYNGRPGAVEAEAPEFLDFLLSESPTDVQQLYRAGIAQYAKTKDLAPLEKPWTYEEPKDPYARFLRAAKNAFYQATVNSKQWSSNNTGLFWLPIEN